MGSQRGSLRKTDPKDWLLDFMRAEVDCVAITDHNSGEWIDRLKSALRELEQEAHAEYRRLYLFPGVEITASGGTHILALLDTEKNSNDVAALLGAVGYKDVRGSSSIASEASPSVVVQAIAGTGGIPILAHVDQPTGAWELRGNTLAPLLDADELFAIEVRDAKNPKPDLYNQRKLAWAEVLGSDSHHRSKGNGCSFPGSRYTWVKMAEPSLEGLRLALVDGGGFSIRRSDESEPFDPFALPEHRIESIEITDARYMGHGQPPAMLEFSPWLNALVGGRGTGKSTVIHALRLAARRDWELERLDDRSEPRLTFERFKQVPSDRTKDGGLKVSTSIEWTLVRDSVRHRVHWRQNGTGTTVEEESGADGWMPSTVQSVTPERFPIRVYSQGPDRRVGWGQPDSFARRD